MCPLPRVLEFRPKFQFIIFNQTNHFVENSGSQFLKLLTTLVAFRRRDHHCSQDVCLDTHTHIHIRTHTHIHIHTYTHRHTCIHAHTHTPIHIHTPTYTNTHTPTYTNTHTHTYTYTHTHTYKYTYIHMYIDAPIQVTHRSHVSCLNRAQVTHRSHISCG